MRFLKKLLISVFIIVLVVVGASFLLPSGYHVERSVLAKARPEALLPYIENLKRWEEWSAWTKEGDPTLVNTYSGPEKGPGASMDWKGEKFGNGTFTIVTSDPVKGITYVLDFENGKHKSSGAIRFEPAGGETGVVWTNDGDAGANVVGRYMNLLMDRFMGPDLQKGLERLKAKVESAK